MPLPPRATKPRLVDKPRHIRKHPLVLYNIDGEFHDERAPQHAEVAGPSKMAAVPIKKNNIYQNFMNFQLGGHRQLEKQNKADVPNLINEPPKVQYQNLAGSDVFDGPSKDDLAYSLKKVHVSAQPVGTNPFKNARPGTSANPFKCYSENVKYSPKADKVAKTLLSDNDNFNKRTLLRGEFYLFRFT